MAYSRREWPRSVAQVAFFLNLVYLLNRHFAKYCSQKQAFSDIIADDLPDIDDIDLNAVDMMNIRLLQTRKVIDYMDRGYINDFETLKRLNRKARHIYGNILNDLRGDPKGVLVIDSFLPTSFLTPEIRQRLSHYATIIGATM